MKYVCVCLSCSASLLGCPLCCIVLLCIALGGVVADVFVALCMCVSLVLACLQPCIYRLLAAALESACTGLRLDVGGA